MAARERLYIVDGSYYIFRGYYALRGLATSKGFPTNALYIFVGMLRKTIDDEKPSHVLVTFDSRGGRSSREEIYPQYKATRDAAPEDLIPQLPLFREIVRAYNIPVIEHEGFEADDVIGTLTRQAVAGGVEVVLVTGDKDLTQLVGPHVTLLDTMRDKRTGEADVRERFGVDPVHVPDVLGLMGDSIDNIPGVPGVGEKTAVKLLGEHGSLERLYENLEAVKGKLKEKLAEHREAAFLSRQLATIRCDLPLTLDLEATRLGLPDLPKLMEMFRELEFGRHLEDLEKRYKGELQAAAPAKPAASLASDVGRHYRVIGSLDELDATIDAIRASGQLSVRLETRGPSAMRADLLGIGLAWQPHHAAYVPLGSRAQPGQLEIGAALAKLGPVLRDPAIAKYGHNTKQDWVVLSRWDAPLEGVVFDAMLASYLFDPSKPSHSLEALAYEVLGVETSRHSAAGGKVGKQRSFDFGEGELTSSFASEDADLALMLAELMQSELKLDADLARLHDTLELPLSRVLARMERHGVLIDPEQLRALSTEFDVRAREIERSIYDLAGVEFNINSPKQLCDVLFERLGLPVLKRTKTGPSTDAQVLEQLAAEHPVPQRILDYRSLSKLKSTYTDALPSLIHPETKRLHTEFRQDVAATGRLSSNNPNLQNIPVRSDEGRRIRQAFVAPPGMRLVSADYSQVELRLLAHMSGDPVLLDAFRLGQDIHARTASELFDVAPDRVDKGMRSVAKTINFGILYGMGPVRLSRELNIPRKEANQLIDRYRGRIRGVRDFLDGLIRQATTLGYARTLLGRRRPLPELKSQNMGQRALGERLAVNTPIQGTAADVIKLAMVNIQKRLDERPELRAHMLLQVHDELVFEVAEADVEPLQALVVAEMEGAVKLTVPLSVDVGVGGSWADL